MFVYFWRRVSIYLAQMTQKIFMWSLHTEGCGHKCAKVERKGLLAALNQKVIHYVPPNARLIN